MALGKSLLFASKSGLFSMTFNTVYLFFWDLGSRGACFLLGDIAEQVEERSDLGQEGCKGISLLGVRWIWNPLLLYLLFQVLHFLVILSLN